MHISSALTLVRRAPAQSDTPRSQGFGELGSIPLKTAEQSRIPNAWVTRVLPGGILLAILVLLGALAPMIF
jgi:hypothetical protein